MAATATLLDHTQPQQVSYCVPLPVRDAQIRLNTGRVHGRLEPCTSFIDEPIAVVGYGPSLNETWEQVRAFRYVISTSGAHKFLIERGIVPTWHVDVDPRKHKIALIGEPHHDVKYLLASTCHPAYFKLLQDGGFDVKLWHVFDAGDDGLRMLPHGEWAFTGGCSVGLRAMAIARMLGFRSLDIFGIDGCEGKTGKHAAAHPMQAPMKAEVVYQGVTYHTTPAFLEAARQTAHELDELKDVTARFHGEGLVQAMMRDYERKPSKAASFVAFNKPLLISAAYQQLNQQLHEDNVAYGLGGEKHVADVLKIAERLKTTSILDYGCGKGEFAKAIPYPIWEYDPAIPGKQDSPRPADIVVCSDVLEHVEPDCLTAVLQDLKRCVKQVGYFVIHTGPAQKTLRDGRNAHLIQRSPEWWQQQLEPLFTIGKVDVTAPLVRFLVGVRVKATPAARPYGLAFARLQFRREPYPIGLATDVLEPSVYRELTATFPALELFKPFAGGDVKYSLSERNNPEAYAAFVAQSPPWQSFHAYIKAPAFLEKVLRVLRAHKVPCPATAALLSARFEFSALPAAGGLLRPHTDLASKVVTLVLSMQPFEDVWEPAWGGGTDVFALTDPTQTYADYQAPADALQTVHTYPYRPNQCVVFIKTPNSWHGVGPLAGPVGAFRRTVTINIERAA